MVQILSIDSVILTEYYQYTVYSPLVQLVERRTVNPYVAGSSPAGGAKFTKNLGQYSRGFFILRHHDRFAINVIDGWPPHSSPAGGAKFTKTSVKMAGFSLFCDIMIASQSMSLTDGHPPLSYNI